MSRTFTAYVEYDPETGLYIGTVPGLQGGHTQPQALTNCNETFKK